MRRRLTVAIVGVVAGALLVAGVGTLVLVRRSATEDARRDLARQAQAIAQGAEDARRPGVVEVLRRALRLEGAAVVRVVPGGQAVGPLPSGVGPEVFADPRLPEGATLSGTNGGIAYAVAPIRGPRGLVAVVLTREVGGLRGATGYFLLAAGVALAAAVVVADSVSRRITRPLREAEAATRRIAAGDLTTRVGGADGSYPELSSLVASVDTMAESLARARGLERQFLLSVSHDLRTPLTSIRGFAEAIAEGATPDTRRAAEVIGAEARRLERLVGDLLDLAKLESKRFSLELRPVDATEVVVDTAEGFEPAAAAAGVALDVRAGEDPLEVVADPDRLAQVVANLVENALKFAASRIEVDARRADGDVVVSVTDDGPGIPPEELPLVFSRSYRSTRSPARQVGSGLGLAIVAELAAAMGGRVDVRSRAGSTRMEVVLRARDAAGAGSARPR